METDPLTPRGFMYYSVAFWTLHASWVTMAILKSVYPLITLVLSVGYLGYMCIGHPHMWEELGRREEEIRRHG